MVDLFISHLQFEKRASIYTLKSYETDLRQFEVFLKASFDDCAIEKASTNEIRLWIASLSQADTGASSINRKIASLRSLYNYLRKTNNIAFNPATSVKSLKTPKKLPQFLDENSINKLLDTPVFTNDFAGKRDELVIELLYGTGLRLSELIGLKDSDIDFSASKITVLGKRNKYRQVPISNLLLEKIEEYIDYRGRFFEEANGLILSDKGQLAYPVLIQRVVKKYLSFITTVKKKSPHVLRHTYATHLLNNGADLNAIKDLLGHASLAATQVYTHNSIEKLKEIHKKAHPKSE